jgi:hypothetical protein
MGRSMDIRLKKHQWHIQLKHPDKLAIAEHSINQGHRCYLHSSLNPQSGIPY